MKDFTREELEAELWDLRSKEYDVEAYKQEILKLQSTVTYLEGQVDAQEKREASTKQFMEADKRLIDQLRLEVKRHSETEETLRKERDWLERKLKSIEQAEHMYSTYGFEVSNEVENPPTRGNRLRR